jgi:small subunit ribosomal protein S20
MPVSKSGKKTVRKNEERRMANKTTKSTMRSQVKKVKAAIDAGDKETAQAEMKLATRKMDKAAKGNVIHKNQAARRKSRLQKSIDKI